MFTSTSTMSLFLLIVASDYVNFLYGKFRVKWRVLQVTVKGVVKFACRDIETYFVHITVGWDIAGQIKTQTTVFAVHVFYLHCLIKFNNGKEEYSNIYSLESTTKLLL